MSKTEWLSNIRTGLGIDPKNTGATAVQVAQLQYDITHLSQQHFLKHKHDFHSKRGLYKKISDMNRLMKYLQKTNIEQYHALRGLLGRKKK